MVVGSSAVDRNAGRKVGRAEGREDPLAERQARLGGARAEFVAGLGTRVAELGVSLRGWQAEPWSTAAREDLRRRLHALAAGARLLRFSRLADDLVTCEHVLASLDAQAVLDTETADLLRAAIARVPALAWGETLALEPARGAPPPTGGPSVGTIADLLAVGPLTALVVGGASLAAGLVEADAEEVGFDIEQTDDPASAAGLARAFAPDVLLVDVDLPGAEALVRELLVDSLTDAVPLVVLGSWDKLEDAAPYVALGVARALAKPVSPDTLRAACAEAATRSFSRGIARQPLGATTIDKLGVRLAEELRRGLCDAVDARGRAVTVELGEGDEVLAALWGAVARIRDLVTIRSRGVVQFSLNGPEGALPMAPWLGDAGAAGSVRASGAERAQAAPGLEGMVVLVADDDPAVTWFVAGALRAAGATAYEARDGAQALELAFQHAPDLVVSDVLMPELDGFALCRALKRDVVLRDVPVILLSWKEDLLQRVRELGADADGYLRKETSASVLVQRVREVMRPRHRVAQRLAGSGEVRGRVDGLTARTLLAFACAERPFSTLTVRDASFLYEVEIRAGRPAKATRTSADGTFERGPAVLASLLGVGAGRFAVSAGASEVVRAHGRAELTGSLGEQLAPHVAVARAAQRLLSSAALVHADRVVLRFESNDAHVDATPEPARSLLRALAAGESPRALFLSGQVSARLLEDVLCDAAAHGAVAAIFDTDGVDLLPAGVERETAVLRGQRISAPPPALSEPEGLLALTPFAGDRPEADEDSGPVPVVQPAVRDALPPPFVEPLVEAPAPSPSRADMAPVELGAEELLGEASPVAAHAVLDAPREEDVSTYVPGGVEPVCLPLAPRVASLPTVRAVAPTLGPVHTLSFTPPPAQPAVELAAEPVASVAAREVAPSEPSVPLPPRRPREESRRAELAADETPSAKRYPRPSAYAPEARPAPPATTGIRPAAWLVFAAVGLVFAVGARWSREHGLLGGAPAAARSAVVAQSSTQPAPPGLASPAPAAPLAVAEPATEADDGTSDQDLPLRAGDKVPAGQGRLEIVAGSSDTVYVDGQMVGKGPILRLALAPKTGPKPEYEVRVKLRGEERVRYVIVKEGRLARVRVAPPWSR